VKREEREDEQNKKKFFLLEEMKNAVRAEEINNLMHIILITS